MDVYTLHTDFDHFQYLLQKTEEDFINVLDREGELFENWKEPTWVLYKKPGKRKDFNVSNYFSGVFLMEENLAKKMEADFNLNVQLLPIKTPELTDKFVFFNILGSVPAIVDTFWYDTEELWNAKHMPKALTREVLPELHGKYAFDAKILEQNPFFRDTWFKGFYFCTDVFVQWAKDNNVKGLRFENAGVII